MDLTNHIYWLYEYIFNLIFYWKAENADLVNNLNTHSDGYVNDEVKIFNSTGNQEQIKKIGPQSSELININSLFNQREILEGSTLMHNNVKNAATILTSTTMTTEKIKPAITSSVAADFRKKLLIVEDTQMNSKFLRLLLEKKGHYCEVATSGHMSVNMVKATSSSANIEDLYLRKYDAVLMNLVMSGMNGRDATRAIRQHGFTGPIIGMSSYLERSEIDSFMEAGATYVFTKPLVMKEVYEILNNSN